MLTKHVNTLTNSLHIINFFERYKMFIETKIFQIAAQQICKNDYITYFEYDMKIYYTKSDNYFISIP